MSDLDLLIQTYMASSAARPEVLFRHFLPVGYRCTTLDSVESQRMESVILAKTHLGMIITLYDDFADHPKYRNPQLLQELYGLNIGKDRKAPCHLDGEDLRIFELARLLFSQLTSVLRSFPHFDLLAPALQFDIEQFYSCNKHSELTALLPTIQNMMESRTLGHHNMGIVGAGTIDLMASSHFRIEELGSCREIFLLGQRLGRISNLIFTLKREIAEGDTTNEILISNESTDENYVEFLMKEFNEKLTRIRSRQIRMFSTEKYADGLLCLHQLYSSLEGRI